MITLVGILVGLLVFVLFSPPRIRHGEASAAPGADVFARHSPLAE